MDPRAFLNLARRLLEKECNPEGLRSSVSRAYYAAFNVAAEFLSALGHDVPRDAKGHKQAYFYLNNCNDEALIQVGRHLNDLRSLRNHADYDLETSHVEKEDNVRNWVDVADDIIRTLDECNSGPAQRRDDIAVAVKAYRKKIGL